MLTSNVVDAAHNQCSDLSKLLTTLYMQKSQKKYSKNYKQKTKISPQIMV